MTAPCPLCEGSGEVMRPADLEPDTYDCPCSEPEPRAIEISGERERAYLDAGWRLVWRSGNRSWVQYPADGSRA